MNFVAASHYDSGSSSSGTVTKPTGTVDNDILFALVKRVDGVDPTTVPTGWSLLGKNTYSSSTSHWLYRRVAASEGADYTWAWAAAGRLGITLVSCRGGFNPSTPIDVVSNTAYSTLDTTARAASISVAAANSPLVFFGMFHGGSTGTFTPPSVPASFTEQVDTWDTGSRFGREIALLDWTGSGATGNMDATMSLTTQDKHAFAVAMVPASTGHTVAVGQVSETDLAQAVTAKKAATLGQPSETDLAQALTHRKTVLLGQASETDLAQVVTPSGTKIVLVGQVIETDLAQAITVNPQRRLLSQVSEANLAQPLTAIKLKSLGIPIETDLAQPLAGKRKQQAIGQAIEQDQAQSVAWAPKARLIGQASETNSALALTVLKGERIPLLELQAQSRSFSQDARTRPFTLNAD